MALPSTRDYGKRASDYVQKPVIGPPWPGCVSSTPEGVASLPANAFSDSMNFIIRGDRLQTRPIAAPVAAPPDGYPLLGLVTFEDALNNLHTLALTQTTAYLLTSGFTYNALTPALNGVSASPYSLVGTMRKMYFCNGGCKIQYANGSNAVLDANSNMSARYLGVLASHLVAVYTTEPEPGALGSQDYPYRVRWSKSGDPNTWVGFTSGYNDILEVTDDLTGFAALGYFGYVFRANGITQMTPTGQGASPFRFDPLSTAPQGIGTRYPYTLDVYGNMCAFVGNDEIYGFDGSNFSPLGGLNLLRIFDELAMSSGFPVVGRLVPNYGGRYSYMTYHLSVPGANATWIFSFRDKSWIRVRYGGSLTTLGLVATA